MVIKTDSKKVVSLDYQKTKQSQLFAWPVDKLSLTRVIGGAVLFFYGLKNGTSSPRQNQKLTDTKTYPNLPISVGVSAAPKEQESPAALSTVNT